MNVHFVHLYDSYCPVCPFCPLEFGFSVASEYHKSIVYIRLDLDLVDRTDCELLLPCVLTESMNNEDESDDF